MHARVTHFQLQPGIGAEFKQYSQDMIIPYLKQVPGFKRGIMLQNDDTSKALSIILLETEEQRQAMEDTGFFGEHHAAFAPHFSAVPVTEHYELVPQNILEEKPPYARVGSFPVHPDKIDELLNISYSPTPQGTQQQPWLRNVWLLVDRQTNKCMVISFWETEVARQAHQTSGALQKAVTRFAHLQAAPPVIDVYTVSIDE